MNTKTFLPAFLLLAFAVSTPILWSAQEPAQESSPPSEIVVPEGTVIPIVLTEYLNTRSSQVGDVFYADTTYPIWVQQRLIIPKGSTIRGTLTEVVRPGKVKGKGRLAVRFDDVLLPNGILRPLVATFRGLHGAGDETLDRKTESVKGASSKGEDVGTIVSTTSTGTIIGALVGHGSGAAIGAGAGAAAGLAAVLFSRGKDMVINPGTRFDLELLKPLKFAYNETQFSNSQLEDADRNARDSSRAAPANTNRNKNILGRPGGIGGISPYPRF
jgi:hypothetical protein